jgi:hypothetical protein
MQSGLVSLRGIAFNGIGIGVCFAHRSSWTIAAVRQGEAHLTASSIATVRSLGQAFGAAMVDLVANTAGLAQGTTVVTGAAAATWVYDLGALMPVALTVLALRLLWLHRQRGISYNAPNTPQPGKGTSIAPRTQRPRVPAAVLRHHDRLRRQYPQGFAQ